MHIQDERLLINLGYSSLSDIHLVTVGGESILAYKDYIDPTLRIQLFKAPVPIKALPKALPLEEITMQLLPALQGSPSDYLIRDFRRISDIVFESISMESSNGKKLMEMIGKHPEANLVTLMHALAWNPSAEGAVSSLLRKMGFDVNADYLKPTGKGMTDTRQTYGIRIESKPLS